MKNNLKIAFLSKRKEIHTVKWVNGLADRGHEVHLLTMHKGKEQLSKNVILHQLPFAPPLGYVLNFYSLNKLLNQIMPDLLNIHYASGYGTLGSLTNYTPSVLSVWGSDVYIFPNKSYLHKKLIQRNLFSVNKIFSTSKAMAKLVRDELEYKDEIMVTPFGIDLNKFKPSKQSINSDKIILGTVKKLEDKYGIDILLRVFGKLYHTIRNDDILENKIEFLIVGGGKSQKKYVKLAKSLGIKDKVTFTGHVSHSEVVNYLNKLDIYFALSRVESFGVAVLEASACELPVVVSNIGGLWEVVVDDQTGYIKDTKNLNEIVDETINLINDPIKRKSMGKEGRRFVINNYSWDHCLDIMEESYRAVIE